MADGLFRIVALVSRPRRCHRSREAWSRSQVLWLREEWRKEAARPRRRNDVRVAHRASRCPTSSGGQAYIALRALQAGGALRAALGATSRISSNHSRSLL